MVRTFQTKFPKKHPREGSPTFFVEKIISGEKIHTFRIGYLFPDGAKLSRRTWSGKPYYSTQTQFIEDTIGRTQNFVIVRAKGLIEIYIQEGEGESLTFRKIDENVAATNDGLSLEDFKGWFPSSTYGQIIHWTSLRY